MFSLSFRRKLQCQMEKRTTSIEKSTVFTQITRGVFVRLVAFSIRVLIVFCVIWFVDIMSQTKSGSVRGASVHCWFWYCVSFTTRLKYGPKCYSKATYDLKWAWIKHPLFQLSNMNNGYNDIWGSRTKWSCQDQIKSKPNTNQKSNLKQYFK